ncbi:MAG: adenosylcobinamide-GDP ribazoletransferase [Deltaproteobacteria bacterium]|nr:adenosylcobinamide-GDP ribazoletransferase [Deltaproteobacteria bacterium]
MKRFFAAIQFLTILPLPRGFSPDERALGGALPFFPVVGLGIGAAIAVIDWGAGLLLPATVTSVLSVILLIAASGGLHIDGLADTADGFFSARPRERILEIMRDSRTGPMGVAAIVCVVALKIALITSVAAPDRAWVLLLTPIAGRSALLIQMALLPYARPEGLARIFHQNRSPFHLLWAAAFPVAMGIIGGGLAGLAAGVASLLFALLFTAYVRRKIGGLTGDTLGAGCEWTELAPALVASAWVHGGFA